MNILKWIWPSLGDGYVRDPRNASATKKGPGRRHKQGQQKSKARRANAMPLINLPAN